ncbi:MAG: glycosyltransferase family 4 protein [Methanomicrobiaceae archaeon]|nr:glycosyltransferase family 4 protein [Methanomicrobiaceae archaeon]
MKIAYVYDAVYPYIRGGVEKRIGELAIRLAARGHEVHLYGMRCWEGPAVIERDGVILHGVCAPRALYAGGRRSIAQAVWFGAKVLGPLLESDADVIDCQNFPYFSCFAAKIASSAHRVPLVITWHEVWGDYWYEYLGWRGVFGKAVERLVGNLGARSIAVSEATKAQLEEAGFGSGVTVIPNGIDCERIENIPPSPSTSDVLFAGRLIAEKNVDLLVEAIALLRETMPDLRCVIIGDGPERARLEQRVADLDLERNIEFTGFLPDHDSVIAAIKASSIFVLPSSREGFGIAALEAMACGLPVVTLDHPRNAVRGLITDQTGFSCAADGADLAEAIERAISSSGSMAEACREYAKTCDWDLVVEHLEELYHT